MALIQILILTSILDLVLLHGLPPHILRGNNTQTCPLDEDRERARNELSTYIHSRLASIEIPTQTLIPCPGVGWTRIAYLNMTDPAQWCPSAWTQHTSGSKRVCFRRGYRYSNSPSCDSVIYNNPQTEYSKVCGRIIGYQYGNMHGFYPYHAYRYTIDSYYVDGISVTHGRSPRKHIWTFAAGYSEVDDRGSCPCGSPTEEATIPPYIGNNYFCETGTFSSPGFNTFYPDDPLWDGNGCGLGHSCECTLHSPPWFTVQFNTSTTDDIEVRSCSYQAPTGKNVGIELIELYVK